MNRNVRIALTLVWLATFVLSSASSALARPITQEGPGFEAIDAPPVAIEFSPEEQSEALEITTREAVLQAKPLPMPVDLGPSEVDYAGLSAQEATGPYSFVKPGPAAPDSEAIARQAYPQDWLQFEVGLDEGIQAPDQLELDGSLAPEAESAPDIVNEPTGTSQVFDSYYLNLYAPLQTVYPHRYLGRLTFRTTPTSGLSYCSASALRGNVMLTAAHCVFDTALNRWHGSFAFQPAYRNGNAPFGTFAATQCWVLNAWVALGAYGVNTHARHDVAVCRMGLNSAGQTLNGAVGSIGREQNTSYVRHLYTMGYPFLNTSNGALPNAGLFLRTCAAESFFQAAETRGMGCDLSKGISGGPMAAGYKIAAVSGYASGVNSGYFLGTRNLYGARFNNLNIVPLCAAAGC